MVVGQMTTAIRLQSEGRVHAVGVRFTPTGARAWFGVPLHELTDAIECVDSVRPAAARQLRPALERDIASLERALRATFITAHRPGAVERAVKVTVARAGQVSIDRLAQMCGVSGRQLERQYLDTVGLTPKSFARTVRFHRALQGLRRGKPAASVATACGFADQSHLAREFRRFAGASTREVDLTHVVFVQDGGDLPIGD
jgi:AraC-like DNA-binding protein